MLSEENNTVEGVKVLFRELRRRVKTVCEVNQMEPLSRACVRCRQDFESLIRGRLEDLDSALTRVEHVTADVKRRVPLVKRMRSRRLDAVISSPTGAHLSQIGTTQLPDGLRSETMALSRAEKRVDAYSVRSRSFVFLHRRVH